jgi:hypothetical protein
MKLKQWFLILSALTIIPVGALYGVSPHWFARHFLGVAALDPNFAHMLRGLMCLYIGFGLFWLYAAFNPAYRNPALLTVVLFPGGLVIGRIISYFVDGRPADLLLFYLLAELIQAPIAWWVFRLKAEN